MGSRACGSEHLILLKNMHKEICLLMSPYTDLSYLRNDWKKLFNRCVNEGIGFITVTMPALGRAVYDSFESGKLELPTSFKKQKHTNLPMFYNGLFRRVYDINGVILENVDIECLRMLIQLLFMFYKYEAEYKPETVNKQIRKYLQIEHDLKDIYLLESDPILTKARAIITALFKDFNPLDIEPHASNGALATGEWGADKYLARRKYAKLHCVYPYYKYFVPTPNSIADQMKSGGVETATYLRWYKGLQVMESGTSKMLCVNKDSRGPRIISMEPLEYQYIQQGLKDKICPYLERKTRNQINFTEQSFNQRAAVEGSKYGAYATYDFSAASDRVSIELVNNLFRDVPALLNALHATRSTHTLLPSGETIKLRKFAPMGSALCFPIMATVIYSVAKALNPELSVLVYGDDLILEDDSSYRGISSIYRKYGLVVNNDKSFSHGLFRESCGADAYAGEIVTPVRIKKDLTCRSPESFVALVESSNEFYQSGYWHLAASLRSLLLNVNSEVPTRSVLESMPGVSFCFITDALGNIRVRLKSFERPKEYDGIMSNNPQLVYEQRCVELHTPKIVTKISDDHGYMIALLTGGLAGLTPPSSVLIRNRSSRSKLIVKWRRLNRTRISIREYNSGL